MESADLVLRLRAHEAELRAAGIKHLAIFGSTARGQAGPGSDIDLLAAFDADARLSLLDVVHLEGRLSDLLGRTVDLVEQTTLRPSARAAVARDLIHAF